jgi:tRNA(adenine34) deaminase
MDEKRCECGRPLDWRAALAGLSSAGVDVADAPTPAPAAPVVAPALASDEDFMRLALAEAAKGDLPFGAVIVRDGKVAAAGHNRGMNDPTAHGEMMAIRDFVMRHPAESMRDATLYTTGEPCPMCMSAILWCGFQRVVYAASIAELATRLEQIMLTSADVASQAPFTEIEITGGVLADEAMALFR